MKSTCLLKAVNSKNRSLRNALFVIMICIMNEWFAVISLGLNNCMCAKETYIIKTQSVGRRKERGGPEANWDWKTEVTAARKWKEH